MFTVQFFRGSPIKDALKVLAGVTFMLAAVGYLAYRLSSLETTVERAVEVDIPGMQDTLRDSAVKTDKITADVDTIARLQQPIVARGAVHGDLDNDGDLDVVVSTNNGPARLFRNDGGNRRRFVRVLTRGTKSNRDGIGARVTVTLAGGQKQWQLVRAGSS